jgi:hypothetical protein
MSTAFNPFTPMAPPEEELIVSQPGPAGWQLTAGGAGSGPVRWMVGAGTDLAICPGASPPELAEPGLPPEIGAVAGAANGPVSNVQSCLQPVAAGPTKVGECTPKLEVVTWAVAVFPNTRKKAASKIVIENEIAPRGLLGVADSIFND